MTTARATRTFAAAALLGCALAGRAHASPSPAAALGWGAPAAARAFRFQKDERPRDLGPDGELATLPGELIAVPVEPGDRLRVEGDVRAVGLGTGAAATPDVVTWLLDDELTKVAGGVELAVPAWSSSDTLVVRAGATGKVRVLVGLRASVPLGWQRFEQTLFARVMGRPGAPWPTPPVEAAEPPVRWLAAAEQALAAEPAAFRGPWLMARWVEQSLRVRPLMEPYFVPTSVRVSGGSRPAGLERLADATEWATARSATIALEGDTLDVARLALVARRPGDARVLLREGDAAARVVTWSTSDRATPDGWTEPQWIRAVFPVRGRRVTVEVLQGEVAVAAIGYRQKSDVQAAFGRGRGRARLLASAAAAASGPHAPLLRSLASLATGAATASALPSGAGASSEALQALWLGEVAQRANDATSARSAASAMLDLLRPATPAVAGPLGRAAIEHVARVTAPADTPVTPLALPSCAHPDDAAAAAAANVARVADAGRPAIAFDAENRARTHGTALDAFAHARRAWASEAPWQTLDARAPATSRQAIAVPEPDGRAAGRCRARTERGVRWSQLRETSTTIDVGATDGTHARVALRAERLGPDVSVRVDGVPLTVHAGSGLPTFAALAPGRHVIERSGQRPLLARYPREGEVPCDELREVQTWGHVERSAQWLVPSPGRPTVAQVVVDAATLPTDGSPVTVRVSSGGSTHESWLRAPASGRVEALVSPSQTLLGLEAERPLDVHALARLHPAPKPPVRRVARPVEASAVAGSLAELRAASRVVLEGSDASLADARARRRGALEALGFERLAALDDPDGSAPADLVDDGGLVAESVTLPAGTPATVALGWIGQVGPLPEPESEEKVRRALERTNAGDHAAALAEIGALRAERADATALLHAVVAERAGDRAACVGTLELLARTLDSGVAFAHAASLTADLALERGDPRLALRGVALAQRAVDAGEPATGALARLAPAHAYAFPSQVESSAGFALVSTDAASLAASTLGEQVRRAWSDAPDDAVMLAEGSALRAYASHEKPTRLVATSRCASLERAAPTCAMSVLLDGAAVTCAPAGHDGTAGCTLALPAGKHRIDVVAPASPETVGWARLRDERDGQVLRAASLVRWSELDASHPFEIAVKGPTVVSLHARVDPGAPRSLTVGRRFTGADGAATSASWDLLTEADPTASRATGRAGRGAPVSRESVQRLALLEEGVHRVRVVSAGGRALVRVAIATPIGLPRPRGGEAPSAQLGPTLGDAPPPLAPLAPQPVFDRSSWPVTVGTAAMYASSNLFASGDTDLTDVSSKSLTQATELQGRVLRELSPNLAWLGLTGFTRLRDGPASGGALATLDVAPHGYVPGVFALGQATFQRVPDGEARGYTGTLEAYGAIPLGGDVRLTPLAALVFNGVDGRARDVVGADPDIYTLLNDTHPRHATVGLRLAWKPFLDLLVKPQVSMRTMPDYGGVDRYEARVDVDALAGRGWWPWLGASYLLSERPVTADRATSFLRSTVQARATAWTWISGAHRVALAGVFQYLFDSPAPPFSQPPFSASLMLSYDFADGRGLRDFPSRLAPFRDRMEEGSNRVHRAEPSLDPSWAIP